MASATHPEHDADELCSGAAALYERALREGRLRPEDVDATPCLVGFGLLRPSVDDSNRLEPVVPVVALHRLLSTSEERVARERRREARLADLFEPLMRLDGRRTAAGDSSVAAVLDGSDRIGRAITQALAEGREELLAIQPHISHTQTPLTIRADALVRDQDFLDRGGRIRTLYQHTLRHAPSVLARYERLRGDAQARTLDEITDRLLVVDRTVAFIPPTRTARSPWRSATRSSWRSSPPPSTACGAWPSPCIRRRRSPSPPTASPPANAPSPPSSSRATPTP